VRICANRAFRYSFLRRKVASEKTEDIEMAMLGLNDDVAKRSPDLHWPDGFSPDDADLFAHNEVSISPSCATVWQHLVEAPKWPLWYSNSDDVHMLNDQTGLLQQASKFEFNTFGRHIDAKVSETICARKILRDVLVHGNIRAEIT